MSLDFYINFSPNGQINSSHSMLITILNSILKIGSAIFSTKNSTFFRSQNFVLFLGSGLG